MSNEALKPLNDAVAARMAGRVPTAAQLAFSARRRMDLSDWGHGKSENIPVHAAAAMADWPFFGGLARLWKTGGLFGSELGSDAGYYSSAVVQDMLLARREILKASPGSTTADLLDDTARAEAQAEDIRLAVRAYLSFLALAAVPVSRMRDELVTGAGVEKGARPPGRGRRRPAVGPGLAVAPAGNRYTAHRRGGLTSDDAGSATLAAALAHREDYGLTESEGALLAGALRGGSKGSAREVSTWLFGTLAGWRWTLRRTTEGAERVFWAGARGPNPNKAARAVGQVSLDGTYRGLQPASRPIKGWAEGWAVSLENGVYVASCKGGRASLPALGGEALWSIEVDGGRVTFT